MASTLLETLRNIENGRKDCIKNLNKVGVPTPENFTINDIADNILKKTNTEDVYPYWERPNDWWETKTILEEAEERDGMTPAYIMLFDDMEDSITLPVELKTQGYLTSDGIWYDNSSNAEIIHTWDKTKDKECSEGYKTRYIIGYFSLTTITDPPVITLSRLREIITNDLITYNTKTMRVLWCNNLQNIEFNHRYAGFSNTSTPINVCYNLKKVVISNLVSYPAYSFTYINSCQNVEYLSIPDLMSMTGNSLFASNLYALRKISLPKLEGISAPVFEGCTSLTTLELPSLRNWGASAFKNAYNLESIYLPVLETISGDFLVNCNSLKTIYAPKLKNIGGSILNLAYSLVQMDLPSAETITATMSNIFCKTINLPNVTTFTPSSYFSCVLLEELNVPAVKKMSINFGTSTLQKINIPSTITQVSIQFNNNANALEELNLPNDFKLNGINLTYANQMQKASLLDMLDKLADVSEDAETYTLTLGATNLAKLTEEEIAVGTNKGWTIN